MSIQNNRRRDPGGMGSEAILVWIGVIVVVVGVGSIYAAMFLGHKIAGTGEALPADPFSLVFGLFGGKLNWPGAPG
ncbi:MAG: conjugal transfer protein, partial [Glutamicibacter arilaitensis]